VNDERSASVQTGVNGQLLTVNYQRSTVNPQQLEMPN